jgi:hypothetical protein
MRRLASICFVLLALVAPARATPLLNVSVAGAVTAQVGSTFQLRGPGQVVLPTNVTLQGNFTYGSGGTTADAYVQTSLDGGGTWTDVAEFHFTTSSARFVYNLNSSTPVTTEYTPTDGSLSANTSKDGVVGPQWRVKYTTTGTYAGGTTLRIDAFANGLTAFTPGD